MVEGRDRMVRTVDYAAVFANRRRSNGIGILVDESSVLESRVQRLPLGSSVNSGSGSTGRGALVGARGNFSSWRPGSGRGNNSPFRVANGKENMPMGSATRGRGSESRSPLPSWYPRTPLRDITHVLRAIERKRRAGMGVGEDSLETEIPTHQQVGGGLTSQVPLSGEHDCSMVTPGPVVGFKRSLPPSTAKVHKLLVDISKEIFEDNEAGFITPEKKLLNSIDKVEKIVMEEIQKLKSTPLAKREEREKKVKTLMSMR